MRYPVYYRSIKLSTGKSEWFFCHDKRSITYWTTQMDKLLRYEIDGDELRQKTSFDCFLSFKEQIHVSKTRNMEHFYFNTLEKWICSDSLVRLIMFPIPEDNLFSQMLVFENTMLDK